MSLAMPCVIMTTSHIGSYFRPNVSATAWFVTSPAMMLAAEASGGDWRMAGSMPQLGDLQHPGERHVAQGERAGAADGAGHVGDAVVHHAFVEIGRVAVRRRPAGLDAAALVDRHVDDHAAGLHQLQVVALDQPRGLGAGNQHGADHQVGQLRAARGSCGGR